MNKWQKIRAFQLFERYKNKKVSAADLKNAENKALNLGDSIGDFKLLIAMCKDAYAGKYAIGKWNMSIIIATIVYVISPVDALPDFIPVLGWMDDITIVGYAISKLSEEISNYKAFKSKEEQVRIS